MTKKHFIELADTLRSEIKSALSPEQFEVVVREMCRFCRSMNGNFRESTFRGYIAGECGPSGGKIRKAA